MIETRIVLHRLNGPSWKFRMDSKYGRMTHVTARGNVYAILSSLHYGMPFWVARQFISNGQPVWCNTESSVKPVAIEFDNGAWYYWQKPQGKSI